ncbi:hypothetical protein BGW37DRAFT_500664 [Umbelopsis sp. PMI_123]|nr:hypothetical protein BGW37DRAFT_500664 [Umbelopsis sp. PMI_123]
MADTDNAIKPIRYRINSHNSQPLKRRKTRVTKTQKKPNKHTAGGAGTWAAARDATSSRHSLSQSLTSSSRTTAPLSDCILYFAQQNEDDTDAAMSHARTLGAQLAQNANECTHVVIHAPHPNKKQQQQILRWKEQGKWVVSLTWVGACMSTWSRQAEFNYPPGRGDHSLVTGDQQRHIISINPFNHEPPPTLDELEQNDEQPHNENLSGTLSYHSTIDIPPPPQTSNDSSLRTLEELAARYAQPPPSDKVTSYSNTSKLPSNQQKIRHAMMAPHSGDPNITIWTEEKMTPEGLMEKHRSGRRKSLRLGYSRK